MKTSVVSAAFVVLSLSFSNWRTESEPERRGADLALPFISLAAQEAARVKLKKRQSFEGYYEGYFSPDGTLVALLYKDHVDVVETESTRMLYRLEIPESQFYHVSFSPDGKTLATRSIDARNTSDKLVLWDATTGGRVRTLVDAPPGFIGVDNLSFSKDGQSLASHAGGNVRIWNINTGRDVGQFLPPLDPPGLHPVASLLSPDGKWLAADFRRFVPPNLYDVVKVWNIETGRETVLLTDVYRDWRFSSDSTMLLITATADKGKTTERAVAELWQVGTWVRSRVIEVPDTWQGAFTLAFSPDSKIAVIGGRKMFGLFSVTTGELLVEKAHTVRDSDSPIYYDLTHIEFSSDGRFLLTAGNDSNVRLWRVKGQTNTQ